MTLACLWSVFRLRIAWISEQPWTVSTWRNGAGWNRFMHNLHKFVTPIRPANVYIRLMKERLPVSGVDDPVPVCILVPPHDMSLWGWCVGFIDKLICRPKWSELESGGSYCWTATYKMWVWHKYINHTPGATVMDIRVCSVIYQFSRQRVWMRGYVYVEIPKDHKVCKQNRNLCDDKLWFPPNGACRVYEGWSVKQPSLVY